MSTALVSRRDLLRRGLLVGGLVAAAGGVGLGSAMWLAPAAPGMRVLSAAEVRIVAAIADTMFPKGAMPLSGVEAGVVETVDALLDGGFPDVHCMGLRYILRTLEWGTLASRGVRFSEASVEVRAEVIETWREPSVLVRRVASDALTMVFGMAYFQNAQVQGAIGYRAACGGVHA